MANLLVEFKGNGIIKTFSKQYPFVCFVVPRESVSTAIPDIVSKMGVYVLVDSYEGRKHPDGFEIRRNIYIGKTSQGMVRFFDHKAKKDWWDKIFYFTAPEEYFDEGTILGIENYLITKYKESELYVMNQEGSKKKIDEDCEIFGEQIICIMDFYNYPIEEENVYDDDLNEKTENIKVLKNNVKEAEQLFQEFDKQIKALAPGHVKSDEMKLYISYKFENKNICALWLRSYGFELELYIPLNKIQTSNSGAFDITSRKRGKKESAIKVMSSENLSKAISIAKEIISSF